VKAYVDLQQNCQITSVESVSEGQGLAALAEEQDFDMTVFEQSEPLTPPNLPDAFEVRL